MSKPIVADLFCGAGGTSIGAHLTGGVKIGFAVNHWKTAIKTHKRNFPHAQHIETTLKKISPSEYSKKINFLFASPECTHHSRARGSRPTSDQQRSGAWDILPWIEYHRPSHVVVENVTEFEQWGPVDQETGHPLPSMAGNYFRTWVAAIEAGGYRVEWKKLNAADYGAATSRERLFIICKKGKRRFCFPEPSHCKDNRNCLPGFKLVKWRGAVEIIDWSIPLPSVFARKRPLKDTTLARIEKGLDRHVQPFIMSVNHGGPDHRSNSPGKPLPTITTSRGESIVCPMIMSAQAGGTMKPASHPVPTITTKTGAHLCIPFITSYYGTINTSSIGSPCPTITTVDRHAATLATLGATDVPEPRSDGERSLQAKMRSMGILDIGFRMLSNSELAAAQGFPLDYEICGTKKEVTRQIGNSVSPPVAKAITESLLGT